MISFVYKYFARFFRDRKDREKENERRRAEHERAERERIEKERAAEKERIERERQETIRRHEAAQREDRQRILQESAQTAAAVDQHFSASLRLASQKVSTDTLTKRFFSPLRHNS